MTTLAQNILKKQILWLGTGLLSAAGFVAGMVFFSSTLQPTPTAIESWRTELDISNLAPGTLQAYNTQIGPVWVYRRTPEQIEWLKTYTPSSAAAYDLSGVANDSMDSKLRSVKPEFFLFTAQQHNGKTFLQEREYWYECEAIRYVPGMHRIDHQILDGLIVCGGNKPSYRPGPHKPGYDVTGVATNPLTAPLSVPYYEFNRHGNIVVSPKP